MQIARDCKGEERWKVKGATIMKSHAFYPKPNQYENYDDNLMMP